ncbi:MAG: hypothetical protein KKH94_09040 [Candidatus Omnitrophica bacterium]|nr:hypothetical protein [Candidatus Omnitrophota bacterium]
MTTPSVENTPHVVPSISSALDLKNVINDRAVLIDTVKASGTITIHESSGELLSYPVVVMFKQPDNLYLRAYQQLMPTIFSIISSEGNFWLYIPAENTIFTGKNASLNYNTEYDVSITPDFLLQSLFSRAIPEAASVNMVRNEDFYTLFLVKKENNLKMLTRTLWLDTASLNCVKELRYSLKGYMLFEITRNNFTFDKQTAINIAQTISIRNVLTNVSVTFDFKKVLINEEIEDRVFEFHYPEAVLVEKFE